MVRGMRSSQMMVVKVENPDSPTPELDKTCRMVFNGMTTLPMAMLSNPTTSSRRRLIKMGRMFFFKMAI
jgi:hypothetical protein